MKKYTLLALFIFFLLPLHSQWCVNTYKLGEFDPETATGTISVLEIDKSGAKWVNVNTSYGGHGMYKYSDGWVKFYTNSDLPHVTVYAIDFDVHDSVWVGTYEGLAQFDGVSLTGWRIFKTDNSDIPDNHVTAIDIDEQNVKWIGFNSGIVATLTENTWATVKVLGGAINDIEVAADGAIWVAKNGTPGLTKYKDDIWTDFNEFTGIKNITIDQFQRVLVAADDSLVVMFNDNIVNVAKGREDWNLELDKIAVGPGGGVWVSSNQGLLVKTGQKFLRYNKNNSPIPDGMRPVPLAFDSEGNLWFSYTYKVEPFSYPAIGYLYRSVEDATPISITNTDAASISTGEYGDYTVAKICFGDSVVLEATESATDYIWADGTTNRSLAIYDSDTIDVAYEGTDNCYYYDTVRVKAQHVFDDEKICVVTVSLDTHNLIVFEKTPEVGTETYNIYKEVQTDVYNFIGNIPANFLSVFVDQTSDPRVKSYKYKITCVDTCQNESGQSFFHKTMHMIFDKDQGNLVWQNYEGMYVPYYIVYKGNTPTSMVPVDTVPADDVTLTWKDVNVTGLHYYRIGVALATWCVPTVSSGKKADEGPYSHSYSNIEDNRLQIFINELGQIEVNAYPNPFNEYTYINFNNSSSYPYTLTVYDVSGKSVRMIQNIHNSQIAFNREGLPDGFYTFQLKGEKVYVGKFVVR